MKINKYFVVIGVILLFGIYFLIVGRRSGFRTSKQEESSQSKVQLVDPFEFSRLAKVEENFLVDVHTPEQTHIPGTDAFIAYDEISENIDKLPEDKTTPVLIYCRSGSMSKTASQEIANLGYTEVYDLEGGINQYKESNVEVTITPDNKDLGEVIYGDVAETSFTLTNFTPLPIEITRVSTSCGCTSAQVKEKKLEAYEAGSIEVSFDPSVHGDDSDLGEITRTIYIDTDNSNFPQLTGTITARVIKE